MSRPSKVNNKEVTNLKNGYRLEVLRQKDIFANMSFENDDDLNICKDIINQLETKAAAVLAKGNTVSLPYIGRLRKPLVHEELQKHRKLLKVARTVMNKNDFKDYRWDTYRECVAKIASEDEQKKLRRKLIAANRKRYTEKYKLFGESGANLWIESLLWLQPIEFNQEVQDVFDEIAKNENNNRKVNNR